MKEDTVYLTNQGIKNLTTEKDEIEQLLREGNQASMVDDKEWQFLEDRLTQLHRLIENVGNYPTKECDPELIRLGSIVQLYDLVSDELLEYMLVDYLEANPIEKKISIQSPIGQILLSKRTGDTVSLTIGNEILSFVIKNVSQISIT